jgi:hypothetical protein
VSNEQRDPSVEMFNELQETFGRATMSQLFDAKQSGQRGESRWKMPCPRLDQLDQVVSEDDDGE